MIKRYLLFSLVFLLFVVPFVSAANFNISERTEFGISENVVYLNVCDNLGKAQYVDISSVFKDDVLTRDISFNDDLFMKQPFNNVVWENQLVSVGKYSSSNVSKVNVSGNVSDVIHYFDSSKQELFCESVLVDKSCMVTKSVNARNFTSMEFQSLPVLGEKIIIDGLKIEQKSLGIPLAKGGCVDLKYSYSHPFAYKLNVSDWVNKYDIWVDNGIEQTILDPLWWNGSYDEKMLINCSGMTVGTPVVINGSAGFDLGSGTQIVWTNCQENLSVYYFSTNTSIWAIANDTSQVNYSLNGLRYDNKLVAYYSLDNNAVAIDTFGVWNGTKTGTIVNGTGILGNSANFSQGGYYSMSGSNVLSFGNITVSGWINSQNWSFSNNIASANNIMAKTYATKTPFQLGGGINNAPYNVKGFSWYDGSSIKEVNATSAFQNNVWYFFTGIYNGTHMVLYINGVFNNSLVYSTGFPNDNGASSLVKIGTASTGSEANPKQVDEVGLWNRSLSANEVSQLYNTYLGTVGFGNLGAVEIGCVENLTNSSPVFLQNISCLSSNFMNQSWNYTTYDVNACGFTQNSSTTFYVQNVSCNYCSFSVVNSTGSWSNVSCVLGDLMNQTRNITEYDENYDVCYAVTNLSSDLWNSGSNNTYIQYQLNGSCDWCVSDLQNMSWSNWSNQVCLNTGFWQQLRTLVQYDLNNCSDAANFTYSEYTSNSSNCTSGSVGVSGEINFAPMLIIFILALFSFTLGIILKQPIILLVAGVLFAVLSAMGFSSYGALLGIVFLVFTLLSVVFGLILAWS